MNFSALIGRWSGRVALPLLVIVAACGSEPPTAPRVVPPLAPVPPLMTVAWDSLSMLFQDPFFESLPEQLSDETFALALTAAVVELQDAIRIQNQDMLLDALARVELGRAEYLDCSCFQPSEIPVLLAISLFQMRATSYLDGVPAQLETQPTGSAP